MPLGECRQMGLGEKTLGTPLLILPNMQAASTEQGWEQLNPNQALAQPGNSAQGAGLTHMLPPCSECSQH